MSLREITKTLHQEAESTPFTKKLIKGEVSKELYADYLYQLLAIYDPIEFSATRQGFFDRLPGLARLNAIYQDFLEIAEPGKHYQLSQATIDYHTYLIKLANDPTTKHLIKAHMYVRHMGDLNGGQIIKTKVPYSSGRFYEFAGDVDALKAAIRQELSDDLGDEAIVAFQWTIKVLNELQ